MVWVIAGTVPFFAFFLIYAAFDVLTAVSTVLMVIFASFMVTELGMLLDSLNPKLFWLDALSALRENYNTVFCMGITIVSCAVLCAAMILLANPVTAVLVIAGILFAADIALYLVSMKAGIRNIMQVGE